MTVSAAQIREARKLLRRSSASVARRSSVGFSIVLQAQLDAEALRAIEQSLVRAGVEFTADSVRLKRV